MCLGIPAQLVAGDTGHPDLVMVDMGGVSRAVNVGLLDEPPSPGEWVLVHMGFALSTMTADEARDALDALGAPGPRQLARSPPPSPGPLSPPPSRNST